MLGAPRSGHYWANIQVHFTPFIFAALYLCPHLPTLYSLWCGRVLALQEYLSSHSPQLCTSLSLLKVCILCFVVEETSSFMHYFLMSDHTIDDDDPLLKVRLVLGLYALRCFQRDVSVFQ
jgi:hypothetical protein